jgi:hypothetical protein
VMMRDAVIVNCERNRLVLVLGKRNTSQIIRKYETRLGIGSWISFYEFYDVV